jgi:hypothetical protein
VEKVVAAEVEWDLFLQISVEKFPSLLSFQGEVL